LGLALATGALALRFEVKGLIRTFLTYKPPRRGYTAKTPPSFSTRASEALNTTSKPLSVIFETD